MPTLRSNLSISKYSGVSERIKGLPGWQGCCSGVFGDGWHLGVEIPEFTRMNGQYLSDSNQNKAADEGTAHSVSAYLLHPFSL